MFAGCIEPGNTSYGEELIKLANSPIGLAGIPYDYSCTAQYGRLTLIEQGQCRHQYAKRHNDITRHPQTGVMLVGWLRLDNRKNLSTKLDLNIGGEQGSDHDLVLAAYLEWGADLVDHLIGDFAFAIHDPRTKNTFLFKDPIGTKPLYYYHRDGLFLFATSISVIKALLPKQQLALNQRWMAGYLLNSSHDWRDTPYQFILKVPPAHFIKVNAEQLCESQYFTFNPDTNLVLANDADYVDAYREILDEAIRCRAISDYPVGAESSGGMDSSTVAVMAAKHINDPNQNFHTFGFTCCEMESECIAAVSQSTPMNSTHIVAQGPPLNNVKSDAYTAFSNCVGTPCEHYSPLSHTPLLSLANQLGVRSMMSGFGGDEFVTAFGSLARVELWENKQIADWLALFNGNKITSAIRALRWLHRYQRDNNHFEVALKAQNHAEQRWQRRIISDDLSAKHSLKQKIMASASYDAGYTSINEFALGNRWAPNMSARLESSTLYAASHNIEYNWPLLDIRLINFFLSVPAKQKLGPRGVGRYLHRRAISGIVPAMITNKGKEMGRLITQNRSPLFCVETDFPNFRELPIALTDVLNQERYEQLLTSLSHSANAEDDSRDLINFITLKRWLENEDT